MAFEYDDEFAFHVYVADGVTVIALTDADFDRHIAAAVVRDVVRTARQTYPDMTTTLPPVRYCLDTDFGGAVERIVAAYDGHTEKTIELRSDIQHITALMTSNLDAIMSRGDELALLVDKSDALTAQSIRFKSAGQLLEKRLAWADTKMIIIALAAGGACIYAITSLTCGGLTLPMC